MMKTDRPPRGGFWFILWLLVAFIAGAALSAALMHRTWVELAWATPWLYDFSTSAGLGGIAALVAALVAYRGVTGSAAIARNTALETTEVQRTTAEITQWWDNARWAADKLLTVDDAEGEGQDLSDEDQRVAQLSDSDASAAIAVLQHLGEYAPNDMTAAFVQEVLGRVLGLDNQEEEQEDWTGEQEESQL